MRRIAAEDQDGTMGTQIVLTYARAVRSGSNINDTWREFAERILRPLFDYLDERVGTESSVLYVSGPWRDPRLPDHGARAANSDGKPAR
jgi:hypothetical protein